jgi:hypothetical protein
MRFQQQIWATSLVNFLDFKQSSNIMRLLQHFVLLFFCFAKWGNIMFHQWDIEMLSIIEYLLHNRGLA